MPKNARYKDVRATIDTGASLSKYLEKIEDIKQSGWCVYGVVGLLWCSGVIVVWWGYCGVVVGGVAK